MTADRPRPAPADHRRPADRQDGDRDRHDHQPEGELGDRRPEAAGPLHLRRRSARRARRSRRSAPPSRRPARWSTRRSSPPPPRSRRLQVHRPLHRLGHRPALDVRGQARPDRVRRPVQAGRGLPRGLAAAAPSAGPRGLPGRRLLPALPPAGALREALRRARRRLDDRPADRRDQGQRRLGLHPDQRHLDHRRPDLPRDRSVQLRSSARPSTSASRCPASAARRRSRR